MTNQIKNIFADKNKFFPINGSYQNYNPIRRLLDGQIPYRDFQDYLGLGHLYTGALVTFIFGGKYTGCLVAFIFLSFFGFGTIVYCVSRCIIKKPHICLAYTNVILLFLLIKPTILTNVLVGT